MPSIILQKMGLSSKPNPYMNPYHPGHVRFRKRPDTSASTSSSSSDAQPVNRTPPPRQPFSTQQSSSDMLAEARTSAGRDLVTGRSLQQHPASSIRPVSSVSNLQQTPQQHQLNQYRNSNSSTSTPQLSRISLVSSLDLYDYPLPPSPPSPSLTPPLPPPKSPKRQSQSSRNSQHQHNSPQTHYHHNQNPHHHQKHEQQRIKAPSSRLSLADQLRQVEAEERTMYQNRSLAAPRTMGSKYELFTQEMARKRDEEMRIRVARGGLEYYAPERRLEEFYGAGAGAGVAN